MVAYPKDWVEGNLRDYLKPVPFFQYLKEPQIVGLYPVIQQGEKPIVGFSNGSAYKNFSNTILFGDHTLSLYKPTNEFFIATDGVKILDCEGIDRDFVYYWLSNSMPKSEGYKRHFSIVKNLKLTIPHSIKEQQAIAETLSTFDEYLENLTKLIEKKKAIRDGALEDLVTGKTRLDGFDSEWKCSRLDKLTKQIITGGTPSTAEDKYWDGEIPWLSSTEIHQKRITSPTSYITEVGLNNSSAKMAPPCSVVVALAGQGKTRGTAAILEKEMALNQSLAAIVVNDGTDFTFLYYALEKSYEALRELSSGDGGRGGLNKKILKEFEIKVPTSKKEQQAIASILNVMDEEISVLVEEKNKIAQLKEGAMDDLLTGRVRLV